MFTISLSEAIVGDLGARGGNERRYVPIGEYDGWFDKKVPWKKKHVTLTRVLPVKKFKDDL